MDRHIGLGLCNISHELALAGVLRSLCTLYVAFMCTAWATSPIIHLHWSTTVANKWAHSRGRGLAACRVIGATRRHASTILLRWASIDLLMFLRHSHIIVGFGGDRPKLLFVIAAQEIVLLKIAIFLYFISKVGCLALSRRLAVSGRSTFQLLLH